MTWVMRWRPRVNRTATAWLIRRFIDPGDAFRTVVALLLTLCVGSARAAELAPLALEKTILLPDVVGRIDHLSIDLARKHLFVAELGNGTIDVVDLEAGKAIGRIAGLAEPQGIVYVPAPDLINNSVRVHKTPTNATISWTDAPGNYNAYRGLKAAAAAFAYNHTCLSANVGANSTVDTGTPLAGQLFFYLVSRVNACSESSLGTNSSGATMPNASACVVP